jgi:hypothetical protein
MVDVHHPLIVCSLNVVSNGALLYYWFARGEMDEAAVFLVLFLASIAVFAGLVYRLGRKKTLEASLWNWIFLAFLALVLLIIGVVSENIVTMSLGTFLLFAIASSFLTSYVRSDHIVKRAFEVVFLFTAIVVIVYGFAVTKSLILGIALLFIATMFSVAFILSYFLPKIHAKSKSVSKMQLGCGK